MLAAISDNGKSPVPIGDALASMMFVGVDSVDERLRGMYMACSEDASAAGGLPVERMRDLLSALLATGQVPIEKRASEVKTPFYRPSEWAEVTADTLLQGLPSEDRVGDVISEEAFKRFLCSDPVCIWAECYRLADEEERRKARELKAERERNPPWWQVWKSKPAPSEPASASES